MLCVRLAKTRLEKRLLFHIIRKTRLEERFILYNTRKCILNPCSGGCVYALDDDPPGVFADVRDSMNGHTCCFGPFLIAYISAGLRPYESPTVSSSCTSSVCSDEISPSLSLCKIIFFCKFIEVPLFFPKLSSLLQRKCSCSSMAMFYDASYVKCVF